MKPLRLLLPYLCFPLFFAVSGAFAQDRIFNYAYQSLVLGAGQRELEVWNTFRWGHNEFYRAFDHRIEFEVGLSNRLQTAFYLNIQSASAKELVSSNVQTEPGQFTTQPSAVLTTETELSFSNEWKYKFTDPIADPFGFAAYGEYEISSRGIELEPRLILDKSFGRTIVAFNASGEFEFEKAIDDEEGEHTEREAGIDLVLSGASNIAEGLYLGAEIVVKNGFDNGAFKYSALFGGPTLSYAQENFWVNLTILPQLTALKGETRGGLVLDRLERIETRLLFSYAF